MKYYITIIFILINIHRIVSLEHDCRKPWRECDPYTFKENSGTYSTYKAKPYVRCEGSTNFLEVEENTFVEVGNTQDVVDRMEGNSLLALNSRIRMHAQSVDPVVKQDAKFRLSSEFFSSDKIGKEARIELTKVLNGEKIIGINLKRYRQDGEIVASTPGYEVKVIQSAINAILKEWDPDFEEIDVDGHYGQTTLDAIQKFQKECPSALIYDREGNVGPETLYFMDLFLSEIEKKHEIDDEQLKIDRFVISRMYNDGLDLFFKDNCKIRSCHDMAKWTLTLLRNLRSPNVPYKTKEGHYVYHRLPEKKNWEDIVQPFPSELTSHEQSKSTLYKLHQIKISDMQYHQCAIADTPIAITMLDIPHNHGKELLQSAKSTCVRARSDLFARHNEDRDEVLESHKRLGGMPCEQRFEIAHFDYEGFRQIFRLEIYVRGKTAKCLAATTKFFNRIQGYIDGIKYVWRDVANAAVVVTQNC